MGPSPNRASVYARKGGEGGGYPLPQVNQFLFEIDIPLLLGVSTLPPPPRPTLSPPPNNTIFRILSWILSDICIIDFSHFY